MAKIVAKRGVDERADFAVMKRPLPGPDTGLWRKGSPEPEDGP
jgi:hypothetical protein